MNRQEKDASIAEFKQLLANSKATFLVNYKGLDVALMQSLRKSLRQDGGVLKVTKARLMKKAAQNVANIEGLSSFQADFKDQVGLVFTQNEISAIAKKLVAFSSEHEKLKVISAFFESKKMSREQIVVLASLPSREVLLAMVAGTMQAPIAGLARVLNLLIVRCLYVLKQIGEKK